MRALLLAAASAALALPSVQAQDCLGDFRLTTQAEVDAFDCETVSGNVEIAGETRSSITNLDGLSELTDVGGRFRIIGNDALTSVPGLASLSTVGGYFSLFDNDGLTDTSGLSNLSTVGGFFEVRFSDALPNIDGFASLTSVGGNLVINSNDDLANLNGLSQLTEFSGNLSVSSNGSLTSLAGLAGLSGELASVFIGGNNQLASLSGLENITATTGRTYVQTNNVLPDFDGLIGLTAVGGDLAIAFNPDLQNVDGLANVDSVGGNLGLQFSTDLQNVDGLASLQTVGGNVTLSSNASLTNVDGLAALTEVGGFFDINSNGSLATISGLNSLGTVGGNLRLRNNDGLSDVDGLASLTEIGGVLRIELNDGLTNVDGLANLVAAGDGADGLIVTANTQLARCAVGLGPILVLDRDGDGSATAGPNTFSGNDPAGDCNAEQDVIAAFEALPAPDGGVTGTLAYGSCPEPPAALAAGRQRCRVQASGTLAADQGQRYTVFLRLSDGDGFSRIAFRGEIKPRPGQPIGQSVQFKSDGSDPSGPLTLELLAEVGSVGSPSGAAVVLGSIALEKAAGAGLRADEPLVAFPNPSAGDATLRFAVPEATEATLVVYDVLGREVARPVQGEVEGPVEAAIEGLAPGAYVARLVAGARAETVRLTVVR